jgi:hypothetical protein
VIYREGGQELHEGTLVANALQKVEWLLRHGPIVRNAAAGAAAGEGCGHA